MKNLAVCGIVLALAALAPSLQPGSFSEAAWGLGTLLLLAFVGQRAVERIGLPSITGWRGAGCAAGAGGLELGVPRANQTLLGLRTVALLWLAFQVGLGGLPRWSPPRFYLLLAGGTLLTQGVLTLVLMLSGDFHLHQALVLGALASLWGPVVLTCLTDSDRLRGVAIKGTAISLVSVVSTLVLLCAGDESGARVYRFASMLLLSGVAGAVSAELMWRLGILAHRRPAILGMIGLFSAAAVLLQPLELYAVPFGSCAGLVVARRQGEGRLISRLFESARPFSAMIFFVLAAASVGAHGDLLPLEKGLPQFVLIQLLILIALRGVVPALWFAHHFDSEDARRIGWLLIPKGVLLFELMYGPGLRLHGLVDETLGRFLHQLVVADLLVYAIGFPAAAALLQWLLPARKQTEATAD